MALTTPIPVGSPSVPAASPSRTRAGARTKATGASTRPGARLSAALDLAGFVSVHALAVVGVAAVGAPREAVALGVVSYLVRCWGVVAGFHRYFSHRTYRLGRLARFVVAVIGTLAMQKGVLWWVATHRAHHAFADTERDPHSPHHRSFAYSHCGWLFDPANQAVDTARVADWAAYPELRWLQRHRSVPVILFAIALWLVAGPAGFVWGFAVSSVVLWHALLATGSFSHQLRGFPTVRHRR